MWTITVAWAARCSRSALPLSPGTDVYSAVTHGLLQRHGLDPYRFSPSDLGNLKIVDAIDPTWRSTASTGGPLSTLTEHMAVAVAGGNALFAVVLLRALAVVCAVAIGVIAAELSGPRARPTRSRRHQRQPGGVSSTSCREPTWTR